MKPQEGDLFNEISKLQCMVSELKTGFSSALLELSQIQHGDTYLREELEENRRSCRKKALRLEALVESLRDELGGIRCQIVQLRGDNKQKSPQDVKDALSKPRESDADGPTIGRNHCECLSISYPRGRILLQSYLQGIKAGICEGIDERHRVTMQLLQSEWEYVSTLNQLVDKYKAAPALQRNLESYQTYMKFVEQLLQRHLLFRNTLQERLSAEHWKCLVGDVVVQLIGHNDSSFTDMYLGYTNSLATFLPFEFSRIKLSDKPNNIQSGQLEREELKLFSLLLAPVSRINSYLSHIQNLLQWTPKDHPDCSLLQGSEKALLHILSRCHGILEEDVRWEDGGPAASVSCSATSTACISSAKSCARCQLCHAVSTHGPGEESSASAQREEHQPVNLTNGATSCQGMDYECWSRSPVRRKSCIKAPQSRPVYTAGRTYHGGSLLTPDTQTWGDMTSDSGQGTISQAAGKGTDDPATPRDTSRGLDDCETDPEDTSMFDYSSVTTCSPDGTPRRPAEGSGEEDEEEEEEDSQVPVLLKPTYGQQQMRDTPRERMVCLRWQIPRISPRPLPQNPAAPCVEGPTPTPVSSYGKRLVSIRQGSPPLLPSSAFRPIWDEPPKQGDAAPVKEKRGFIPIQTPGPERQTYQNYIQNRSGMTQQRGCQPGGTGGIGGGPGLWDESEDSEGPCSTV